MLRVELPPKEIQRLREVCRDWTFTSIEFAHACGARRTPSPSRDGSGLAYSHSNNKQTIRKLACGAKPPKGRRPEYSGCHKAFITSLEFHRDQQQEHKRPFGPDYQDRGSTFCGDLLVPHLVLQTIFISFLAQRSRLQSVVARRSVASSFSQAWPQRYPCDRLHSHAVRADDDRATDAPLPSTGLALFPLCGKFFRYRCLVESFVVEK